MFTNVGVNMSKKKQVDTSPVKTLDPKDADTKYMGVEPLFTIQPENRNTALISTFTWYNRFYNKKTAKEFMIQYLELNHRLSEAKLMRKVEENVFNMTISWLARMTLRGLQLVEHEQNLLENELTRLIKTIKKNEQSIPVEEKEPVNRPNVQEIMKDKAREAGGELEGLLDAFISEGCPTKHNFKPIDEVAKKNILSQHISILVEVWKKKLSEFEEVQEGKDIQLVQAYSRFTKTQIKNLIKFCELVLGDLNSYISIKKASKTPRKRKAVPVEKQVAKLKFLKEFKDPANKLDLVSLHPIKLHGASEAWVYDTAKRKLHHYIADEYSKEFTVKGNTLLGFDTNKSEIKTLRKPSEQIKEVMGSKPAARKFFDAIKSVAVQPNGRFNKNMIILKAF